MARRGSASSNVYTVLLAVSAAILTVVLVYTWMTATSDFGLSHPFEQLPANKIK